VDELTVPPHNQGGEDALAATMALGSLLAETRAAAEGGGGGGRGGSGGSGGGGEDGDWGAVEFSRLR
jgi:hypothetical protein